MTILAGVVSLQTSRNVPDGIAASIKKHISREPSGGVLTEHGSDQFYIAKFDIGAFGEPALRIDEGGRISAIVGHPLLDENLVPSNSRAAQLDYLHAEWSGSNWSVLGRAYGQYAAIHFAPGKGLTLIADQLGIRTLYYWVGQNFVVFATALRILEKLPQIEKVLDLRGVTELISLEAPMADRTPYRDTYMLDAAEIVHVAQGAVTRQTYKAWDSLDTSSDSEAVLLEKAHETFLQAIRRRLGNQTVTQAFLSGGLDSRTIVGGLRDLGVMVHTFNFSLGGSYDYYLGEEVAEKLGTIHYAEVIPFAPFYTAETLLNRLMKTYDYQGLEPPQRPRLVWSGIGGDGVIGFCDQTQEIVDLFRAGKKETALRKYLSQLSNFMLVPKKLLRDEVREAIRAIPRNSIREQLERFDCADPGRAVSLKLLLNFERRHLVQWLEDIDRHRMEPLLPFYDTQFVELMMTVPIDLCLYHRFYNKWLFEFAAPVTEVAWQPYPGHEPGPVPLPEVGEPQWSLNDKKGYRKRTLMTLARAGNVLRDKTYPSAILRTKLLPIMRILTLMGIRNYDYLFEAAETYHRYWNLCRGRYVLEFDESSDDAKWENGASPQILGASR